jgi:ABC-type Fe3+/spermidine/putrescine transport system ATPase subunit
MTTIRLDSVSRTFGAVRAVENVSATIEEGELFTLSDPPDAARPRLLRMIAGFADVEAGSIWFDDRRIDTLPAHHRSTGMVFQNYAISSQPYGGGQCRLRSARSQGPAADIPRVEKALAGAPGRLRTRWPHQLSGGQLQRVAIARVLVIEPAVCCCSMTVVNLDATADPDAVEIRQLQQSLGLTLST